MAIMYNIKVNVLNSAKFLLLVSVTVTMMMSAAAAGGGGNYNNGYGSSVNTNQGSSNYYYHTPYPPPSSHPVSPPGTMPPIPYPPTSPSPPSPTGVGCNPAEYPQAQSELASAEQGYLNLKTKYYQDYKQLVILGKYNGTWDGYAKENLLKSPEVDKIRQIHEQYSAFVNYCYRLPVTGKQPSSSILPVTHGSNIGTISPPLLANNSNNNNNVTAATTKATTMTTVNDTLMEVEPATPLPMWIKNNAKWWAEDQITDSDFILGMQYLISHKIIQLYPSSPTLSSSTPSVLPQWVKGLAGSWADGKISNDYFVSTIQFLANKNIIKLSG